MYLIRITAYPWLTIKNYWFTIKSGSKEQGDERSKSGKLRWFQARSSDSI